MTEIQPKRINADNFAAFGRVVRKPARLPTAEDHTFRFWSDIADYRIEGDTEIGLCTVYRQPGNPIAWMERHERTPELLIPIDTPFVLPVMSSGGDGSLAIEAFRVEPGEAVVIGTNVWHSACLPVNGDDVTYFVIFRRGTPSEDVSKTDLSDVSLATV